jgi:hypothetical protein
MPSTKKCSRGKTRSEKSGRCVRKPCGEGKKRKRSTGKCVKTRVKKTKKTSVTKTKIPSNKKRVVALLKKSYGVSVNGKIKVPSFVSTFKSVPGRTFDDKLAKVRLVLSTCKKMNKSLLKKTGKSFKSFKTLVSECKVKFKKTSPIRTIESAQRRIKRRSSNLPKSPRVYEVDPSYSRVAVPGMKSMKQKVDFGRYFFGRYYYSV